MVNSTRTEFTPLPVRHTRNRNAVLYFPTSVRSDGAPVASGTENTQQHGYCAESHGSLSPSAVHNQYEGKDVTCVQGSAQVQMAPRATQIEQERRECLESAQVGLGPSTARSTSLPQVAMSVTESVSVGEPQVAGDKLEGYEPRYFLKEDGKDDVS